MHGYHMGINLGHDRSVAVVRDGEILIAIEQERLDRIKHSVGFMVQSPSEMKHIQVPGECIRYCLDALVWYKWKSYGYLYHAFFLYRNCCVVRQLIT